MLPQRWQGRLGISRKPANLFFLIVWREFGEQPGFAALADNVELVVSELATNAVHASRGLGLATSVRLWLLSDAEQVLITVWDASPYMPIHADVAVEAESSRELLLVGTTSSQWGTSASPAGGKTVWALLTTP
jgi:hypothetical protein